MIRRVAAIALQFQLALQCGLFVAYAWGAHSWPMLVLKALLVGLIIELCAPMLRAIFSALEVPSK